MKWTSLLGSSVIALCSAATFADDLTVANLGNLTLSYTQVKAVQQLPASPVPAFVTAEVGNTFYVTVPETIQQRHWLVAEGATVTAGQPLVLLQGAGIHHFYMQFDAAQEAFTLAQSRYEHNRKLHANGTIGAEVWSQISMQYHDAKLTFEHMHHFMELLEEAPEQQGSLLKAPMAGVLRYGDASQPLADGGLLLGIVPEQDIRLQVSLPLSIAADTSAIDTGSCQLAVVRRDNVAKAGFVDAWSATVAPACHLTIGQQLQVTPLRQLQALQLPKRSVYSWGTASQVLRHQGDKLLPTNITILAVDGDNYLVQAQPELQNSEVLSDSVAAAKGVLLGLGGE
ncbi:membrane fusion-like protein [Shewanella sp.]|uniref:membrane fusion-like protein n=1 Tax=Shewanella sp. TaxID=50422 RepID=UPI003D0E546E